jgi:hypothetical protein
MACEKSLPIIVKLFFRGLIGTGLCPGHKATQNNLQSQAEIYPCLFMPDTSILT